MSWIKRDLPSTQSTEQNLRESVTCIHCRQGQALITKEGIYVCQFCGKTQQRGFSHYTIQRQR